MQAELRQKVGGGAPRKVFANGLSRQAAAEIWEDVASSAIHDAQLAGLSRAVVKVVLREDALAKSHRPHYLLEQAGRNRVIGGLEIGELLLSVSDASIAATADAIRHNETRHGTADISTIDEITRVTSSDVLVCDENSDLYRGGAIITLFDFLNDQTNQEAAQALLTSAGERGLQIEQNTFGRWIVREASPDDLVAMSSLPMVREVSPNAELQAPEQTEASGQQAVPIAVPDENHIYSTVGLLDTGVSAHVPGLAPWISEQINFIHLTPDAPPGDFSHGTFIAGLLVQAGQMNGGNPAMPSESVKIHDVRVFSTIEGTTTADVIARIDDAVRAAPHVKVWNLSLGINIPEPRIFSQFARDIDTISSKHGVLFVIAAGNCNAPVPLRPWPVGTWPTGQLDLITPPADSALALSVGSIAHNNDPMGGVPQGAPTPYSRRGPGPAAIPKPELVHFGGNCTLQRTLGGSLASLCPLGTEVESFGTSFASPLVAGLAARIWGVLADNGHQPTPELVKAFLIHSAAIAPKISNKEDLPFFGFGLPGELDRTLLCSSDTFTTFHSVYIPRGQQIHHSFAMPACLVQNDRFRGELTVTLCYAPILNERDGTEYCRSNVSVALGTIDQDAQGKHSFHGRLPPEPSAPEEALEKRLIEHGFKWSPVKVYRAQFPRGISSAPWELRFDVLYRAGEKTPDEPQLAHAIVSVRGLDEDMPVYRDGVRALNAAGHAHQALVAPQQIRNR